MKDVYSPSQDNEPFSQCSRLANMSVHWVVTLLGTHAHLSDPIMWQQHTA